MTSSTSLPRQAALIYNPIKVDKKKLRASVRKQSERAGWAAPAFYETTVDDAGQQVTKQALDNGAAVVLVAGGDGTVRAVSEAMAQSGVPLAIVPSGTGNLLARNLGLPLADATEMIRAAHGDFHHPIDIGWAKITRADGAASEHAFVVLAGIGLDAAMIANTSSDLKKSVGWIAYVDGAARAVAGAKQFRGMYQLNGGRLHTTKMHSMLFANCGMLPAGISLVPGASITDGAIDIAIIQASGPLGWFNVWRKVWWENSVMRRFAAGRRALERRGRDASVRYLRGQNAEVAAPTPIPIELDGDEFGEATRLHCRVDPGALLLALPHDHPVSDY